MLTFVKVKELDSPLDSNHSARGGPREGRRTAICAESLQRTCRKMRMATAGSEDEGGT